MLLENGIEDEKASAGRPQTIASRHRTDPEQFKALTDNGGGFRSTTFDLCLVGRDWCLGRPKTRVGTAFGWCRTTDFDGVVATASAPEILTESLILAQDERWRRA
jgi:hypothetical protein